MFNLPERQREKVNNKCMVVNTDYPHKDLMYIC